MSLQLKGDDVATAIRGWISNEIKQAPSFGHDLGKHYFTTTTATIGLVATLAKLDPKFQSTTLQLSIAFAILFAAAITALLLSIPLPRVLGADADLFLEYNKTISRIVRFSILWLILWVAGALLALSAIL